MTMPSSGQSQTARTWPVGHITLSGRESRPSRCLPVRSRRNHGRRAVGVFDAQLAPEARVLAVVLALARITDVPTEPAIRQDRESAFASAVDQNGDGTFDSTEGLFATGAQSAVNARDGLQQTVADLMQVVRAIQGGIDVNGDGSVALDPHRIYYFGQSLGGIYGTIFLGAEPDVHTGVPNVPGGTLTDIARLSPDFRPLLTLYLASQVPPLLNLPGFNFDDNFPLRNQAPVINSVPGATAIQNFEEIFDI